MGLEKGLYVFWFRNDLRLSDNPGLFEAAQRGPVMPIYILDDSQPDFEIGGASKWWLSQSLKRLNESLENMLHIYAGNPKEIFLKIIEENPVKGVYWNRRYEPHTRKQDQDIKESLRVLGLDCKSFSAALLWEPWEVLKSDHQPYQVYTYFYRHGCLKAKRPRAPLPKPAKLILARNPDHTESLEKLDLLPGCSWQEKLHLYWEAGEEAAQKKLEDFSSRGITGYKSKRDYPAKDGTSKLSPHLHFGEISPHQMWEQIHKEHSGDLCNADIDCFLSEIAWREFSYYLLYHFPELPRKNFQKKFDAFPWAENESFLRAWQEGKTGYPIVDAGMRELWQTGYMHNRVRMIVASFLVKNLLVDWQQGADWFWDCLVDADLANNSASWQWIAGCGADASPYFRIFNPVTQGEKFDPDGTYTRFFLPELKQLPNKFLFKPWEASENTLAGSGVILGENYPKPIISLDYSRKRALMAYQNIRVPIAPS